MPSEVKTEKTRNRSYDPTVAYLEYFEGRYIVNGNNPKGSEQNGKLKVDNGKPTQYQKSGPKGR